MTEVKYHGKSPEQRIADRYKPSNSPDGVNVHTKFGDGPTRVVSTHHWAGHQSHHEKSGSTSLTDRPVAPGAGAPILGQPKARS
jgi:hypothetical protein